VVGNWLLVGQIANLPETRQIGNLPHAAKVPSKKGKGMAG
jgi:hypothetical protein